MTRSKKARELVKAYWEGYEQKQESKYLRSNRNPYREEVSEETTIEEGFRWMKFDMWDMGYDMAALDRKR